MERDVLVQAEAGGGAAILVTIRVPKTPRTEWLRRSWDLHANGSLDEQEAERGARAIADVALADVLVLNGAAFAQCERSLTSSSIVGALDDRPFQIVALLTCEPAREWAVFAGLRVPSSLKSAVFRDACVGVSDERLLWWLVCPNFSANPH